MRDQLAEHLSALFKFYRRSRLLLAIGLVYLAGIGVSVALSVAARSGTGRFELIRALFDQLNGFASVLTAALGLLVISSHLRRKTLKVVFTKPSPPDLWLAACLLSAATVSLAAHASTLGLVYGLSLAWGVPLQPGFAVLSAHAYLCAMVLLGFVTFLTMAVHPAIAVMLVLVLRESTFFWLRFTLAARVAGEWNAFYWLLERVCYVVYLVLPSLRPYEGKLESVSVSLRASPTDAWVLLQTAGYSLACLVFYYALSAALLRRKDLS
jgi:hypothetical protein